VRTREFLFLLGAVLAFVATLYAFDVGYREGWAYWLIGAGFLVGIAVVRFFWDDGEEA
jgi:hypothetical protein